MALQFTKKRAFSVVLLTFAASASGTTEQARTALRNYGLVQCLDAAYTQAPGFKEDLAAASLTYHFMGSGSHIIEQNEDTLDVTHDPYRATADFVTIAAARHGAQTKVQGGKSSLITCMTDYKSAEYAAFIASQDTYIRHDND